MSSKETSQELLARTQAGIQQHLQCYLSSGGAEGHIRDFTGVGARGMLPTLLLQTVDRRSGRPLIAPLIYGCFAGEWVVVASKGGAPDHPAWYLNLLERPAVSFQIATQAFHGTWRLPEGDERQAVWAYMANLFPPYERYQASAKPRQIPVVMLKIAGAAPVFQA